MTADAALRHTVRREKPRWAAPMAPPTVSTRSKCIKPGTSSACSSGGTRLDGEPSGGMSVRHESIVDLLQLDAEDDLGGTS